MSTQVRGGYEVVQVAEEVVQVAEEEMTCGCSALL
jgi:hypothetical protein